MENIEHVRSRIRTKNWPRFHRRSKEKLPTRQPNDALVFVLEVAWDNNSIPYFSLPISSFHDWQMLLVGTRPQFAMFALKLCISGHCRCLQLVWKIVEPQVTLVTLLPNSSCTTFLPRPPPPASLPSLPNHMCVLILAFLMKSSMFLLQFQLFDVYDIVHT